MHVTQKEVKQIFNQLKHSAERRGIAFDLTVCELNNLGFPVTCPVFDIPLTYNRGKSNDNSYSIDRKDSSLGYTIDNIVVISNRANKLKSDATLDELRRLYKFYEDISMTDRLIADVKELSPKHKIISETIPN